MTETKPRFAIMGSGGVGGYFGARLVQAGYDTSFIARGAHLDAIRKYGLRIEDPDESFAVRADATDDPAEIGPVDFVLFAVKLWDTEQAGAACRPMLGPDSVVVSLQNGVDSEDQLCTLLGAQHVMGGVAEISATIAEPGLIKRVSPFARARIGELDGRHSPRSVRLAEALSQSGIEVDHSDNITEAIWNKFLFLVGLSALTALTRQPIGRIRKDPDTRALFKQVIKEVLAVAMAKGIPLSEHTVAERMQFTDSLPGAFMGSMAIDLERGNRLELDWLSGAVVRLGKELGVPTPANSFVYTALKLSKEGTET